MMLIMMKCDAADDQWCWLFTKNIREKNFRQKIPGKNFSKTIFLKFFFGKSLKNRVF